MTATAQGDSAADCGTRVQTFARRYCFQLRVDPARLDEYRARHAAVWPEMLQALDANGWHNYSLFVREDGLLIGYVELDRPLVDAQRAMNATEVNARWQADMSPFFLDLDGAPDTGFLLLTEVFHLEDQMDAAGIAPAASDVPASTPHESSPR